ncbi:MAG TPA: CPBP family intramembrane glutamic endopeptidase [Rubrobacter sp.]|nr:CPBP family intramembrane glutamic endopeptidase [Rubrobacter sp.]
MTSIRTFVKRHPLLSFFVLTFAISWGDILIVAGGPGGISANNPPSEMLLPLMLLALFAGPAVASIVMTGLVYGREGFRDLLTRMTRWRVGARWYAVALLTVPLLVTTVLLALSLTSPAFLPSILTTSDKASVLLFGIVAGLIVSIFEEIGWTGFAIPRLLARHGVLASGIIVGVLWGAWHFPVFFWGGAASSGTLPLALYLFAILFSILPAYRVLMVWVYDRTESLLVAILMHTSLLASQFIIIPSSSLVGVAAVTLNLVFTAVLWAIVGGVAVANHGHLSRQPLRRRVA